MAGHVLEALIIDRRGVSLIFVFVVRKGLSLWLIILGSFYERIEPYTVCKLASLMVMIRASNCFIARDATGGFV